MESLIKFNLKISIIIPAYNQAKYLPECLNSALNQNFRDYEIILINDGSTDNTLEICEDYAKKYSKISLFSKENGGLGSARNAGILHAKGEYLLFLDSDDCIEQNCLENLYSLCFENKYDLLYFDEKVCDAELKLLNIRHTLYVKNVNIDKYTALGQCLDPAHICARMYKKTIFQNIQFSKMWYEDMMLFPEIVLKAKKIGYYRLPIYYYRQHNENITSSNGDDRNLDIIKAWNYIYCLPKTDIEQKNIINAIKKSIKSIILFRKYYSKEYIEWYNKTFGNSDTIEKISKISDYDTALSLQLKMYPTSNITEYVRGLETLANYGGKFNFYTGAITIGKYNEKSELKVKILGNEIVPDYMTLVPKSIISQNIIMHLSNQEIFDENGGIRDTITFSDIIFDLFIETGGYIDITIVNMEKLKRRLIKFSKNKLERNQAQYTEIACFGCGIRSSRFGDMIKSSSLLDRISCFIDNNPEKQGRDLLISNEYRFPIISFDEFVQKSSKRPLIIILNKKMEAVLEQIDSEALLKKADICTFEDIIYLNEYEKILDIERNALKKKIPLEIRLTNKPLIPKKIHYCWFGKKPIPKRYQDWISNWHKLCPEYEIIRWDESNYNVFKNPFLREAYENQKWAFVSDYARLDILYENGGIYLDVDVELLKNLDELLYQEAFAGFESNEWVNFGVGYGAVKGFSILIEIMEEYNDLHCIDEYGKINYMASCPRIQTRILQRHGLITNGEYQQVSGMTLFPEKMFCAKSWDTKRIKLAEYTKSVHHYDGSWEDEVSNQKYKEKQVKIAEALKWLED